MRSNVRNTGDGKLKKIRLQCPNGLKSLLSAGIPRANAAANV